MTPTTRMAAVGMILIVTSPMAQAQTRRGLLARLAGRGETRVAARTAEVPTYHQPVYEYQAAYIAPVAAEATAVEAPPAPAEGDPYGFAAILNGYRAQVGLPPVAVDGNLSAWASQNNAAQCNRGIGHHVVPGCLQNSGWNYTSAWEVFVGWVNSPGHRANLLSPSITRMGIAYGPGPYWTMNAQ